MKPRAHPRTPTAVHPFEAPRWRKPRSGAEGVVRFVDALSEYIDVVGRTCVFEGRAGQREEAFGRDPIAVLERLREGAKRNGDRSFDVADRSCLDEVRRDLGRVGVRFGAPERGK